jgi:hypothetical protein
MNLKLFKIIKELYEYLNNLQINFYNTLLEKKLLVKKYSETNYFLSKNILSFVNNLSLPKQITGLSLKSYINLIELILIFRRFFFFKHLRKFNFFIFLFFFRIILFCYLISIILKKILSFFFLKILIIDKKFILFKKNNIFLSFNFPQHAFEKRKSIISPGSFYENIIFNEKKNLSFLSFGDHQRISKKKFSKKKNYPYIFKVTSGFSINKFFTSIFLFFRNNNKFYQNTLPVEISLLNFLNLLNAYYYEYIIKSLESNYNIRVKRTFFLMFSNPFFYYYNYSIKSSVHEFFYAENIFVPSLESLGGSYKDKILKKINFRLWGVTNHAVGFVKNINNINIIQKKYFLFLNKELILKDPNYKLKPSPLGYENCTHLSGKKNIIFFDVKPYFNNEENLKNNAIFDIIGSEFFINKFNSDIISVIGKTDYNFYLKPKYSLDYEINLGYKKNLIEKLKKYNNFKIINPYSNLDTLSKNLSLSISIPFTSTFKIMNDMGISSKYYCPDDFKYLFVYNNSNKNILFGKKSLLKWINYNLKKKTN